MSAWAGSVGADAFGIDLSADRVEEATRLAEGTAEYRVGSVYEHGLPADSFDVAYSRWLLIHLNRPVDAMRAVYDALRPGGVMVCEEADLTAIYTEPASDHYHRFRDAAIAAGVARGVDYTGGRRLHLWAREAGFDVLECDAYHPHYVGGPHKGVLGLDVPRVRREPRPGGRDGAVPAGRAVRRHAGGRRRPGDPRRARTR